MTKRYVVVRKTIPKPQGGFWDQFELGLVDLNSWGEQHFDLGGYPYPDETHAFVEDWLNLSKDFSLAIEKMNQQITGMPLNGQSAEEKRRTDQEKIK